MHDIKRGGLLTGLANHYSFLLLNLAVETGPRCKISFTIAPGIIHSRMSRLSINRHGGFEAKENITGVMVLLASQAST